MSRADDTVLLGEALKYAGRGWPVFPLIPGTKRPLVSRGFQAATRDEAQIREWWTQYPDANIGVPTGAVSGLTVLDVDIKPWKNPPRRGDLSLAARAAQHGALPSTVTQRTWSGGEQYFFYHDPLVPQTAGALGEGLDTRNDGGYVVVPPSVVAEDGRGGLYYWTTGPGFGLALAPTWLRDAARPAPAAPAVSVDSWLCNVLAGSGDGTRGNDAARLCGYLWGKGLPVDVVTLLMEQWAERCNPPMESARLYATIESICRREGGPAEPPASVESIMDEVLAQITAPPGSRRNVPTGLRGVDAALSGGPEPGEYVMVGARPSIGKSVLAVQIARQRALAGDGVLYLSTEGSKLSVMRRFLCQQSGVRARALKTGQLVEIERRMLDTAQGVLRDAPLWLDCKATHVDHVRAAVEAFQPGDLKLVVADYVQNFTAGLTERHDVEAVSKAFNRVAKDCGVVLLALSSLSRPDNSRGNWRPSLASLRDSGRLEHDADIVMLMHREEGAEETDLNIAKARDDETGHVPLAFDASVLTFRDAR